jgi:hypothetical protein
MKVLIFLGLIVALFAVRLTSHDYEEYDVLGDSLECTDSLHSSISNVNGRLVADKYDGGFQDSCYGIFLDDRAEQCIIFAVCKDSE